MTLWLGIVPSLSGAYYTTAFENVLHLDVLAFQPKAEQEKGATNVDISSQARLLRLCDNPDHGTGA